jgi:hypothetical protein
MHRGNISDPAFLKLPIPSWILINSHPGDESLDFADIPIKVHTLSSLGETGPSMKGGTGLYTIPTSSQFP